MVSNTFNNISVEEIEYCKIYYKAYDVPRVSDNLYHIRERPFNFEREGAIQTLQGKWLCHNCLKKEIYMQYV